MGKIVTDSQHYTDIAAAIREKNGTETTYKPSEMASAIQGIQSGGGGGELDGFIDGSFTEIKSTAVTVRPYVAYTCTNLISADFPFAKHIGQYAFYKCSNLNTVNFPELASIDMQSFNGCKNLKTVFFPALTTINTNTFRDCGGLTRVELPSVVSIAGNVFYNCLALVCVILSNTETVCTLTNVSAFANTPIQSGTGYIYVPDNLVDSYKAATNWSTYASQIKGLSELPA